MRKSGSGSSGLTYRFFHSCVGWPVRDVDAPGGLNDLIAASEPVTRRTFLRYVCREDLRELESRLGYCRHYRQGLTMAGDWHVGYFRSMWRGVRVYGFMHSAIEYVFVPAGAVTQPPLPIFGKASDDVEK